MPAGLCDLLCIFVNQSQCHDVQRRTYTEDYANGEDDSVCHYLRKDVEPHDSTLPFNLISSICIVSFSCITTYQSSSRNCVASCRSALVPMMVIMGVNNDQEHPSEA
jgi:hypothetical protein